MRFIPISAAIILSFAASAPATELRQPVMSGSKYTYADLLRKVFPNLRVDKAEPEKASASKSVVIRHITGDEKPFEIDSDVKIEDVRRVDLHIAGKPQVVLMFTLEADEATNGASEIALFDLSGSPKLLDIAEAPSFPDDHGWLDTEMGLLHLSDAADAFVVQTAHSNSSEGFQIYTPIFVHNHKLKVIDTFDLLSCNDSDVGPFVEKIAFTITAEPGKPYGKVAVRVTLELLPDPPDGRRPHRTRKSVRTYSAEYRWDAGKGDYKPAATELAKLYKFNSRDQ